MPIHLERGSFSSCDGKAAARHTASAAPPGGSQIGSCSDGNGRHFSCEVRDGLPTIHRKARGHYVSRQGCLPMLVLEHGQGDRIRINDVTELTVIEIHHDQVQVAIRSLSDDARGHSQPQQSTTR